MARRPRAAEPPPENAWPAPRQNRLLLGHVAPQATFAESLAANRVHHAWLLTGPPGIGKSTLAFHLARRLLGATDPDLPAARRIAAGTHADILLLARALNEQTRKLRREITVDQVREMVSFMRLTPAEGGWRVIIVDGAEDMNRNAANALLKVLEEPPHRAILFLTSDAPGRLLPTIRSRCRRLKLDPLSPIDMESTLAHLLPDMPAPERTRLAAIAEGAPGRAVALAGEGALALAALADDVLAARSMPVTRMHEIADKAIRGDDGFETFMALLRAGLSARVRSAARDAAPGTGPDPASAGAGLNGRPLAEWFEVWHGLGRLLDETSRFNLDKRTAVIAGLELLHTQ